MNEAFWQVAFVKLRLTADTNDATWCAGPSRPYLGTPVRALANPWASTVRTTATPQCGVRTQIRTNNEQTRVLLSTATHKLKAATGAACTACAAGAQAHGVLLVLLAHGHAACHWCCVCCLCHWCTDMRLHRRCYWCMDMRLHCRCVCNACATALVECMQLCFLCVATVLPALSRTTHTMVLRHVDLVHLLSAI